MGSLQNSASYREREREGFERKTEEKKDVDCYDASSRSNEKPVFTQVLIIGKSKETRIGYHSCHEGDNGET